MSTPRPIANVLLYLHRQRVEEKLAALGLGAKAALTPNQIAPSTTTGTRRSLGLGADSCALDIGAGFSVSARYLAQSIGCRVMCMISNRCCAPHRCPVLRTMRQICDPSGAVRRQPACRVRIRPQRTQQGSRRSPAHDRSSPLQSISHGIQSQRVVIIQ
jgi:hypothetical protein